MFDKLYITSGDCEIKEVGGFLKYVCDIPLRREGLMDERTYSCVNSTQMYNIVHLQFGRSVLNLNNANVYSQKGAALRPFSAFLKERH